MNSKNNTIKYLTPDNLHEQLKTFTAGMAVTKGSFELVVKRCMLEDIEWNHMDQLHRPTIHNTYEKGIRIATGCNFALSLTEWGKWPFLIQVTDVYVSRGLFYQSLTLAGIIFIHSIISMEQIGDDVKLIDEWYIASRKIFKFLHKPIDRKLFTLNARLQEEDEQVRQGRFDLRKKGYQFRSDAPNYFTSNQLGTNTIYPPLDEEAAILIDDVTDYPSVKEIGGLEFVVKREKDTYSIWPAACPHEGGPLINGQFCDTKIACPWHGLMFSPVVLSSASPVGARYGFEYSLRGNQILVTKTTITDLRSRMVADALNGT